MDAFWRWSMIYKPLYIKPIINTEVTFPYDIMPFKNQAKKIEPDNQDNRLYC